MSNDSKRRQGAERLFGALSGVDEEYLAACEKDRGGRGSSPGRIMFLAQKYGKAAAVLGIAVLGIGLLGLQAAKFPQLSRDAKSDMQFQNGSGIMSGSAHEEPEMKTDGDASAGEMAADSAEAAPVQKDPEDYNAENMEKFKTDSAEDKEVIVEDQALTLALAGETSVVGNYLPSALPPEGEIAWVTRETLTDQERVTFCWTYPDGKGSFLWTAQNFGMEEPDWEEPDWKEKLPEGQSLLEGAEMTRDDMEAQIADAVLPDGRIDDGVLCICYHSNDNYILIVFQGSCDTDTLWEMLRSVG